MSDAKCPPAGCGAPKPPLIWACHRDFSKKPPSADMGRHTYLRLSARLVVYDAESLDEWMTAHRVRSTSEASAIQAA